MAVKVIKTGLYYLFLLMLALLFLFPIIWMVMSSFKPEAMIATDLKSIQALLPPINVPLNQWLIPYKNVFERFNLIRGISNSLLYGSIVVSASILVNSMAAYALAKMNFPGKGIIFTIIILIMIVPMETGIVPLFVIVNRLGLVNSIAGLVAPGIGNVFNIFLFRQFFIGIPKSLEEAAVIDGASKLRVFFSIIIPLSKPIIATVAVLTFIGSWNDFLWPVIIFTDNDRMPLQVILNVLNNTEPVYTNEVMAALTISTIPIILIYAFFQKYIVEGVAHTGIK